MVAEPTFRIEIFYCYAREDKDLRDELDTHLAGLHRSGLVTSWHDGKIVPGTSWEDDIEAHLSTANIILLLISPAFIKSDYCYSKEMTRAIERHEANKAHVVPILLRPVDWTDAPFSKLQMLPANARPVIVWPIRDEALENVARGIRKIVNKLVAQHEAEQQRKQVLLQEERERIEARWRQEEQERRQAQLRQEAQARMETLLRPIPEYTSLLQPPLIQKPQQSANARSRLPIRLPIWLTPVLIGCVFFLVFATFGVIAFKVNTVQQDAALSTRSTAAALANKATVTQGAKITPSTNSQFAPVNDATLKDRQKQFDDIIKSKPTIDGFHANEKWDTTVKNNISFCGYDGYANYVVIMKQSGRYAPCIASGYAYKNFALQVTMDIKGDAGGVIFRYDPVNGIYYRLSVVVIYQQSTDSRGLPLFLCNNRECASNGTDTGNQLSPKDSSTKVDKGPLTLTIIARDKNIDIYVNGKYLYRFTETNAIGAGLVGVYAADLNNETRVTFSGLKIWSLDKS